jgi:uncharacterized protein (TIGR00369 family)
MTLVPGRRCGEDRRMVDRKAEIARRFTEALPHARALGMEFTLIDDGVTEAVLPYRDELIGDPATGVIAGGVVSALMDTCGGAAVLSHSDTVSSTATLDLRIDYMRGATPGQTIRARATCYHVTRTVAFVRALAWDDDERPIATAAGAFTVER